MYKIYITTSTKHPVLSFPALPVLPEFIIYLLTKKRQTQYKEGKKKKKAEENGRCLLESYINTQHSAHS